MEHATAHPSFTRRTPTFTMMLSLVGFVLAALLPSAAAQTDKVAADYYVRSLTGAPEGPLLKMHAG